MPDILTLGKGLGGGVPLAALVAHRAVSCFDRGEQGGTYSGNPLMTAVGCAVLDTVAAPAFLAAVRERGRQLQAGLCALAAQHALGAVRVHGLLAAVDVPAQNASRIVQQAFEAGLLINAPRDTQLRLMPALTISSAEIDELLQRLAKATAAV